MRQIRFQSAKAKGWSLPPEEEVRTFLPCAKLSACKLLCGLTLTPLELETAIKYGRQLEGVLEYFEDPVAGKAGMSEVALNVSMPLATNMCCVSFAELPETIQRGSVQIILSDHHICGAAK